MAAPAVQPSIWSPFQAVRKIVVTAVRNFKAIQNDFRRSVRNVVAVRVGNEKKVGWTHQPDASMAHFHAGQPLDLIRKNLPAVRHAIVVQVFKDENAIPQIQIKTFLPLGIGEVFRNPKPPSGIPIHGDGILDLGFGCENCRGETFR